MFKRIIHTQSISSFLLCLRMWFGWCRCSENSKNFSSCSIKLLLYKAEHAWPHRETQQSFRINQVITSQEILSLLQYRAHGILQCPTPPPPPPSQYKLALHWRKLPLQRTEIHILFLWSAVLFQTCWLTSPEPSLFQRVDGSHWRESVAFFNWIHIAWIMAMIPQDWKMQLKYCNSKPKCISGNIALHLSISTDFLKTCKNGSRSRAEFTITPSIAARSRSQFAKCFPILLSLFLWGFFLIAHEIPSIDT